MASTLHNTDLGRLPHSAKCEIAPGHARGFYVYSGVQGAGHFRCGAVHLNDLPLSETTHWLVKNSFQMNSAPLLTYTKQVMSQTRQFRRVMSR
jgi:hypothetical protein